MLRTEVEKEGLMAAGHVEWWRAQLVPAGAALPQSESRSGTGEAAGSPVPFWALMAFTFVLLLAPQTFVPSLVPLRIGLLTAAVAITTYLVDRFICRKSIMKITPEVVATAALAAWALLTVPLSYWPGGSLAFLLDVYFKTLAIFWLLGNVVSTRARLRMMAWGLALMTVPLSVFGINEYLAGRFVDGGPVKRILTYEAPLTQNPNDLALMLNLILPPTLGLALVQRTMTPRLLLLGCAALDAVAVILTFSRAGFICLAMTGVIYVAKLLKRPGRVWAIVALFLALACAPLLPSGYLQRLSTITDIQSDPTGSAQERWGDTQAAIHLISQSPIIGAGAGMNIFALNEMRGAIWKKVHNVYLEYAVDLGLPGLFLFLVILVGGFRSAGFVMRRTAGSPVLRDLFLLAEGIQVSLATFAVAALFHPVAYQFYFYSMAGLALAARAICESETHEVIRCRRSA
jgi:O-antigen ligase